MGDEDEVDVGKMVVGQAGVAETADHEEPVRPIGVHENVSVWPLNEERGVADPGEADLAVLELGKNRSGAVVMTPFARKEGGEKNIGDEAVGALLAGRGAPGFQET